MAEVKWIKICTDIFDDEKIALIESMPDADGIIVVWFKLLCMAGKQNNGGVFMLNDKIAYTDEMLATVFRRPLNTVRLALETFEQFGMIEVVNNAYTIPNWEKHQNLDKMEQAKEQTRQRVAKHREKQKLLALNGASNVCQYCGGEATGFDHIIAIARGGKDSDSNKVPCCITCNRIKNDKPLVDFLNSNRDIINDDIVTGNPKLAKHIYLCNVTSRYKVTQCNADRIEEDKDKEKDRDIDNKKKTRRKYGEYNNVLLTDEDMEKLQAEFPDWKERIERLSAYIASTGKSYKNHLATIRNWARNDKPKENGKACPGSNAEWGRKEIVPDWMESNYRVPKFKKTAAEDDEIRAKAEALRKELGGNG